MYPIYIEQPRSQLSLNDYLQLQALLRQEQAEREHRLLQEYKKEQERRRIEKAMYKLEVMTELYRRREQEERAIQAYYAAKREEEERRRQQQLLEQEYRKRLLIQRQRQQQQEYLAALQQRQELEEQWNLMAALARQQQQQKSAEYANPLHALATAATACCENATEEEPESESEADDEESRQDQLASLVKLIFGAQDNTASEEEEKSEEEHEEEYQEQAEAEKNQEDEKYTTTMNLDQFVDYISKKAQALDDEDSEEEEEVSDNQNEESEHVEEEISANQDEEMEEDTALLAIEHIDDEESMDEDDFEHIDNDEANDEDIVSIAVEHLDDEEEDDVPALVESNNGIQELVNEILTQDNSEEDVAAFPTEDPVKIAKYDALHRIEQELNEIRQKHEDHVLHAVLDFSDALNNNEHAASREDTLITATTAANREFLGYEDQIMKALLKLDMIESDGDKDIRNARKALVKLAEGMLDKLDDFKQREWERVSCSSHSEDEDMYM